MKNKECNCKMRITDSEIQKINQCDVCYKREIKKLKIFNSILKTSFDIVDSLKKQPIPNYVKGTDSIKPKSITCDSSSFKVTKTYEFKNSESAKAFYEKERDLMFDN